MTNTTMLKVDRSFARRRITWKIKDISCATIESAKLAIISSPKFSFGGHSWSLDFEKRYDAIKMEKFLTLRLNGTHLHPITFTATILTMRPQISYDFSKSVVIDPKNTRSSNLRLMTYGEFYKASKLLFDDDCFTIEVELEAIEKPLFEYFLPTNYILDNLEKLINNEVHSDFVFNCSDNRKICVQKANISLLCPALAAMFDGDMFESKFGQTEIHDIDSATMLELLRFVYCGRVNDLEKVQEKLLLAANKFGLQALRKICVSSLMGSITVDNVFRVLDIADSLDEKSLKENCIDFIKCKYGRFESLDSWPKLEHHLLKEIWKSCNEKPILIRFENKDYALI